MGRMMDKVRVKVTGCTFQDDTGKFKEWCTTVKDPQDWVTVTEFNAPGEHQCPGRIDSKKRNVELERCTGKARFTLALKRRRLACQPHHRRLVVLERLLEQIKRLNGM